MKIQAIFLYELIANINLPDARRNLMAGIVGASRAREFRKNTSTCNNIAIPVKKITSTESLRSDIIFPPGEQNSSLHGVLENDSRKSIVIVAEVAGRTKRRLQDK